MIGWYAGVTLADGRVSGIAGPFRQRCEAEATLDAAAAAFNRSCRETGSNVDAFAVFGPLRVARAVGTLPAGSHNDTVGVMPLFGGWVR